MLSALHTVQLIRVIRGNINFRLTLRYLEVNGFFFLQHGSVSYGQQTKSDPLIVFVNKVLLEPSNGHLFTYCLWLLCSSIAEMSSRDKTDWFQSIKD